MLNQSKKLTDGLIVYSVLVSEYEKMDFKNDALAGVRANYFNSSCTEQRNKTEVIFEDKTYNLAYQMKKGSTISWKITRNNQPYQSVKKATGGVYSVIFYSDNGIVYKRQYFDDKHIWLRTEYFDKTQENILVAVISPKNIFGVIALHLEKYNQNGDKEGFDLFPSADIGKTNSSALVYSNCGMLWYDTSFMPEDMPDIEVNNEELKGFVFNPEISENENSVDFSVAESLNDEDFENIEVTENTESVAEFVEENTAGQEEQTFSAYEQIEKILTEAHKTNKDLFGEIITHTADMPDENDVVDETEQINDEAEENNNIEITYEVDNVVEENIGVGQNTEAPVVVAEPENIAEETVETTENISDKAAKDEVVAENNADEIITDESTDEEIVVADSEPDEDISVAEEEIDNIIVDENIISDDIVENTNDVVDTEIIEDEEVFESEDNSNEELIIETEELSDEIADDLILNDKVETEVADTTGVTDIAEEANITEVADIAEVAIKTETADEIEVIPESEDTDVNVTDTDETYSEDVTDTVEPVEEYEQEESEDAFEMGEAKPCDVVIVTKAGRYSYFGKLDENNCRTGRGRTVTPDGFTSYDGEYKNDKKDGFGVCYYKNGDINYVGNWSENNRSGCGVGYRSSDGTMHIGKWDNNKPQSFGARFDSEGNFLDVSNYENGVKNGKSVSFDDNGNIIISMWKNGEKISETLIRSEDLYG